LLGGDDKDNLVGGDGSDTLDGGSGEDIMRGGEGDDTYVVNTESDRPQKEKPNGGNDTIESPLDWTINKNVENLLIIGPNGANGTGNNLDNSLTGNRGKNRLLGKAGDDLLDGGTNDDNLGGAEGDDTLIGGMGNDQLTGGDGSDWFTFNTPGEGKDIIEDFSSDIIGISVTGFGSDLTRGTLQESQFALSSNDSTADTRFIYSSGRLFFDSDGNGGNSPIELASFTDNPGLVFSDIIIF
jgi:Ca2+-binding RTX toxin-like protein